MPRIEWIEQRLLEWARWKLNRGGGVLGYAGVGDLAEANAGRDGYVEAAIPTSDVDASECDTAIGLLLEDQQRAVHAWYLRSGGVGKDQAARKAGMAPSTMFAKIEIAHHRLSDHFGDKARRRAAERERVEALQRSAIPRKQGV